MDILIALVVGGIAGWFASVAMKAKMGLLAYVVVGVVGSLFGHWVAGMLGIGAHSLLGRLLISVAGAMGLIALLRVAKLSR